MAHVVRLVIEGEAECVECGARGRYTDLHGVECSQLWGVTVARMRAREALAAHRRLIAMEREQHPAGAD